VVSDGSFYAAATTFSVLWFLVGLAWGMMIERRSKR